MGWDPQEPGDKQGHLFTWVGRTTPGHAARPSSETQEGRSSAVLLGPGGSLVHGAPSLFFFIQK